VGESKIEKIKEQKRRKGAGLSHGKDGRHLGDMHVHRLLARRANARQMIFIPHNPCPVLTANPVSPLIEAREKGS
jgi:hypothetical protein